MFLTQADTCPGHNGQFALHGMAHAPYGHTIMIVLYVHTTKKLVNGMDKPTYPWEAVKTSICNLLVVGL